MAKNKLKFPQISRIFTAVLLVAFLFLNFLSSLPQDVFELERAKLGVLLYPQDLNAHLFLAQEYLKRGDMKDLERELLLSQALTDQRPETSNSSVLGASLSPLKVLEKIKGEPQRLRQEIAFWEKVAAEKPDYRDAYLQLAILNYQIYETNKAKENLAKALDLDPNFAPTRELEKIID